MNKLLRKTDIVIIVTVLLICAFFFILQWLGNGERIAEISVNGSVTERINLDRLNEKKVIIPDTQPKVVIVAENGSVYFESAECRDKICVKKGKLSHRGDIAACLPSKTVITVLDGDIDAVTY